MNSALSPREIQARLRGGATLAEVAADAGVDESDIEGFAGPVLAEREFMAKSALGATIRRRGESAHRRLGELITERLQHRRIDADIIEWDSWRQEDLRWRVVGVMQHDSGDRKAEFVFDHKARYSVADNADARWLIGEELPDARGEDEMTVDLDDELALVRATKEERPAAVPDAPGDDVPVADAMHDDFEDTSELDALYDMLSGISEDSVRIYTGLEDDRQEIPPTSDQPAPQTTPKAEVPFDETVAEEETVEVSRETPADEELADDLPEASEDAKDEDPAEPEPAAADEPVTEPVQDSLVEDVELEPKPAPKKTTRRRKGRASIPSWDEIMFGGPTR